eukprot:TRINITY_DN8696_c0_g1_i4.p1 TRINITY_DN8696_c0_g1~~TRINITY_DN8696_c0_g1_i4.p1  ORF type:complete len:988 (+),score=173.25 TRINITY_DN8696_c0_g1_i4:54-3017(+)
MCSLRSFVYAFLGAALLLQSYVLFQMHILNDHEWLLQQRQSEGTEQQKASTLSPKQHTLISTAFPGQVYYFSKDETATCPKLSSLSNKGSKTELDDVSDGSVAFKKCAIPQSIEHGDYELLSPGITNIISICDNTCRRTSGSICLSGGKCYLDGKEKISEDDAISVSDECSSDDESDKKLEHDLENYGQHVPKLPQSCFGDEAESCISSIDTWRSFAGEYLRIRLTSHPGEGDFKCALNGTVLPHTISIQSHTDDSIYMDSKSVLHYDVTFPNMKFGKNNLDAYIEAKCHIPSNLKPGDYFFQVDHLASEQHFEFWVPVCSASCRGHGKRCKQKNVCICESGFTSKDCTEEDHQLLDNFQQRLSQYSISNNILMIYVNSTSLPLAVNLWHQLKMANIHNILFTAANMNVGKALEKLGVAETVYNPQHQKASFQNRLYFVHSALSWGYDVFSVQADIAALGDIWSVLQRDADVELFSQSTLLQNCVDILMDSDRLASCHLKATPHLFYVKHGPTGLRFVRSFMEKLKQQDVSSINPLDIAKDVRFIKARVNTPTTAAPFLDFVHKRQGKKEVVHIKPGVILLHGLLQSMPSYDLLKSNSPRVALINQAHLWTRKTKLFEDAKVLGSISSTVVKLDSYSCSNNCNFRGHCDRGTCFCWGDFKGADCSEEAKSEYLKIGDLETLAAERADENGDVVIITINLGFVHFAVNLINSFQKLNLRNYICIALDKEAAAYIQNEFNTGKVEASLNDTRTIVDVPLYYNEYESSGISVLAFKYMKGEYVDLVNLKVLYTLRLLHNGYNVLVSDGDTFWLRNPMSQMYRDSDLSLTVDGGQYCYGESASPDSNYPSRPGYLKFSGVRHQCTPYLSTGFYFARSSVGGVALLTELFMRTVVGHGMEQITLNQILRERRNTNWRELPICQFRNGQQSLGRPHNFCVVQHTKCLCDVYVSHINYLTAQLKGSLRSVICCARIFCRLFFFYLALPILPRSA